MIVKQGSVFNQYQSVTLMDGPLDGKVVKVPFEWQFFAVECGPTTHRYVRLTEQPFFFHESVVRLAEERCL